MISALSHTTLAVRDLEESFRFYTGVLGLRPVAKWYRGAYLLAGPDWLCLNVDPETRQAPLPEYTHIAFSVTPQEFSEAMARLREAGVTPWQDNHSFGDSYYFLDPNGHKLEIHASDLTARLEDLKRRPPRDLILF